MSVFDKLIHQKDKYDNESLSMLGEFIRQLDRRSGKEDPDKASADMKYARALQRARLTSKSAAIYTEYDLTPETFRFVNWKLDTDTRYKVRIPFYELNAKTEVRVNNRRRKVMREKQKIYGYAVWLLGQRGKMSYCCPNCGGTSTVEELLGGCPYCSSRFLMSDLYPKISSIYTQKELNIKKHLRLNVLFFVLAFTALFFCLNAKEYISIFNGTYEGNKTFEMLAALVIVPFAGIFVGVLFANLAVAFRVLGKYISTSGLRGDTRTAGRQVPEFMRHYEPNFSLDYFITKLVGLTQVMIYTDDYKNCAVYAGEPMENKWRDIIDARYRGFPKINECRSENGYLYVDADVCMDDVYCLSGRLKRKNERFRLVLRKNASAETDYGFSIHAINCRSCGASFDATKQKHCPNCGNTYAIDSYDWVVVKFESR